MNIFQEIANESLRLGRSNIKPDAIYLGRQEHYELISVCKSMALISSAFYSDGVAEFYGMNVFVVDMESHFRVVGERK